MVGLSDAVTTIEGQLFVTLVVATLAFAGTYLVRRARGIASDVVKPVAADLVSAVLVVGIVTAATMAIVDVWGHTDTLNQVLEEFSIYERAPEIAVTLVVVVATQIFAGIARRLLNDLTRESDAMTEHQREVSFRLTQLLLWTVALIVVLGVWEVNLGGLLVGAGFLGIVLGMASRKTLGSLLAGFVLMFSRPFEVGDWIAVEDKEGIVTDITLMNTRIQAFDGEYVVVPNDSVSSQLIVNRTRKGRLRLEVDVGVDYDVDVERACEIATGAVGDLPEVLDVPKPETVVKEFGDSGIVLGVRGWIDEPSSRRRWRARTAMVQAVKDAFETAGIKIPYPQRELSGREERGGFQVAPGATEQREPTGQERTDQEQAGGPERGASSGGPDEGGRSASERGTSGSASGRSTVGDADTGHSASPSDTDAPVGGGDE